MTDNRGKSADKGNSKADPVPDDEGTQFIVYTDQDGNTHRVPLEQYLREDH